MNQPEVPCGWAPLDDKLYRDYHDDEWGIPVTNSKALWAKLQLDGMQAGLSWITILRKKDAIMSELDGLNPEALAKWDSTRIERALKNTGIIRSKLKISACVSNAKIFVKNQENGEDFSKFCWSYVNFRPIVNAYSDYRECPAQTPVSEALSKDLKKQGYKFVGPVIVYAWMQAVGLVNDHELGCPRREQIIEFCEHSFGSGPVKPVF